MCGEQLDNEGSVNHAERVSERVSAETVAASVHSQGGCGLLSVRSELECVRTGAGVMAVPPLTCDRRLQTHTQPPLCPGTQAIYARGTRAWEWTRTPGSREDVDLSPASRDTSNERTVQR